MKVLVIGDEPGYEALQRKGGLQGQQVRWIREADNDVPLRQYELVIDLAMDEDLRRAGPYARHPQVPVLAAIAKTSLAEVMNTHAFSQGFNIIGCNWLPGFIDMPVTEVSVMDQEQQPLLKEIMAQLGWEYQLVQDGVGMVTPRVVCMIINEAYMTAEEGTASREDIDTAMRLGTNYPLGPFEWCRKIGVQHVHDVLAALRRAAGGERYRISAMLEAEAAKARMQKN